MATLQSEGILLHKMPYSESSTIAKIYTRESGLLSFIAKGAMRPKSKMRGQIDFFRLLECTYNLRNDSSLIILQDVTGIKHFENIQKDLIRSSLANVILEIYLRFLYGPEPSQPLYELLAHQLDFIDSVVFHAPSSSGLLCDFIIQFCSIMGFKPQFSQCVFCEAALQDRVLFFYPELGGAGCFRCSNQQNYSYIKYSQKIIKWLDSVLVSGGLKNLAAKSTMDGGESLLLDFLKSQSGHNNSLKSYSFYKKMVFEN